jgi:bifunctional non-homologous end joining protein LigD
VGENWIHEVKFDGYRTLARVQNGKAKFFTRNGLDWTRKYGTLADEVLKLPIKSGWIDGEIVAVDEKGVSQFHELQDALSTGKTQKLVFYAFDLLEVDGEDLRDTDLKTRKDRLRELMEPISSKRFLFSEHWSGSGKALLQEACKNGLEGILSKDQTASYISGRGNGWIKSKCHNDEEFIVCGYILSEKRDGFRSLLLGTRKSKKGPLEYVGRVGTGFTPNDVKVLLKRFSVLETEDSPFKEKVPEESHVHWLKPKEVVQIAFRGWTGDGLVRQGAFKGLRLDKGAKELQLEKPLKKVSSGVKITHPGKVIIPEGKVTKQDLVDYYKKIEKWILPHVVNRPLSLLRCPEGIRAQCFFQKNLTLYHPKELEVDDLTSPKGKSDHFVYLENIDGIIALAQMGALEIHTWGTHRDHPLHPDLIVFDLDPGPGVPWNKVVEATYLLRDTLDRLSLKSFVKTSGGKGFHIHVPVEPNYTWEEIKEFAKTVAQLLEQEHPDRFVSTVTKSKRGGKIFIDYLRNGYGATSIAPYSMRARKTGPVALPISWEEVRKIRPDEFTLKKALTRLSRQKKDPWADYFKTHQKIAILEKV